MSCQLAVNSQFTKHRKIHKMTPKIGSVNMSYLTVFYFYHYGIVVHADN